MQPQASSEQPANPSQPEQQHATADVQTTSWYNPEDAGAATAANENVQPVSDVSWTASEFIAHDKPAVWFVGFGVVAAVIGVATYLLTREIFIVVIVLFAFVAFGIMASRKPRVLEYMLDDHGVTIAHKLYPYASFKSYSFADIAALRAVDFMPAKRFNPIVTIYFPPEYEQQILAKLGQNLPFHERNADAVERLMHSLRF